MCLIWEKGANKDEIRGTRTAGGCNLNERQHFFMMVIQSYVLHFKNCFTGSHAALTRLTEFYRDNEPTGM